MVTYGVVEQVGPLLWRVHFSSDLDAAAFYVWGDGRLLGTTLEGFYDITPGARLVQVEVFDGASAVPGIWYPSNATLSWSGREGDTQYRIEVWDGAAWVVVGVVLASTGPYLWESPVLEDGEAYLYRVVPVDAQGRGGTPLELGGVMCRYPDAPAQTMAFSGGEITVS